MIIRNCLFLYFFILYFLPTQGNSANTITGEPITVIVGTDNPNEEIISMIRSKFELINGVKVLAYCSNFNVFVITSNSTNETEKDLINKLQKAAGETRLYLKEGKFRTIIESCEFVGAKNDETLKELCK